MNVLGLSAFYHDSAACLLTDGVLVAAAQQERFSRIKHDRRFPSHAVASCLSAERLTIADVDCVAWYENPEQRLLRQRWLRERAPTGADAHAALDASKPERAIREVLGFEGPITYVAHHAAHAASSFYFSGFDQAGVMTVDAVGEWASTTYGRGAGTELEVFEEVRLPHSLGLFYSAITAYLGFRVNDGEYKVMGLAPYGSPRFVDALRRVLASDAGGGFRLDTEYVDLASRRAFSDRLAELLGRPPRAREEPIASFHQDVARSSQALLEDTLLEKVRWLHGRVGSPNLCLAGGVALNAVANGRILREGPFERLFVPPAPGDAGGALGAAALAHVERTGRRPEQGRLLHAQYGPRFADRIARQLAALGIQGIDHRGREALLLEHTVDRLITGRVVGWFHGRMEFGPRALGGRSILADPRDPAMRDRINALVKKREAFRPFAPSVLLSEARRHFELDHPAPFMLETCAVRSPLELPAITHVDGSARPQTVDPADQPRFAALIARFFQRTGCPMLLNTSMNVMDEPIASTPVDALRTMIAANLDSLVLDDFLVDRAHVPDRLAGLLLRESPLRDPAAAPASEVYESL
jgi:carbamoyltransferase